MKPTRQPSAPPAPATTIARVLSTLGDTVLSTDVMMRPDGSIVFMLVGSGRLSFPYAASTLADRANSGTGLTLDRSPFHGAWTISNRAVAVAVEAAIAETHYSVYSL